jgi:hypothetical protein
MAVKSFSLGMAVGYVLGAKAGEHRYEQIVGWSQKLLDSQLAERLTANGKDMALDRARQVVDTIKARGFTLRDVGGARRPASRAEYDEDEEEDQGGDRGSDEHDQDDHGMSRNDDMDDYNDDDEDTGRADARDEYDEDGQDEDDSGRSAMKKAPRSRSSLGSTLGGLVAAARERGRVD